MRKPRSNLNTLRLIKKFAPYSLVRSCSANSWSIEGLKNPICWVQTDWRPESISRLTWRPPPLRRGWGKTHALYIASGVRNCVNDQFQVRYFHQQLKSVNCIQMGKCKSQVCMEESEIPENRMASKLKSPMELGLMPISWASSLFMKSNPDCS